MTNHTWQSRSCDTCLSRFVYKQEDEETEWLNLGDGRELCSDCSSITVTNSDGCSFIIQSVFEFYKTLDLKVDEKIPILFVDRIQMRKYDNGEVDEFEPAGLYLPSMSSYLKTPVANRLLVKLLVIFARSLVGRIDMIEKYSICGGDIKKVNAVKFLLGHAILLLFGQPDIEMGETLSHEMMHSWLHLQGTPWGNEYDHPSSIEGICEVMSYKWLEWFSSNGLDNSHKTDKQVQYTRELKESLAERKWCRGDEVYGQGFIDAMRAIEIVGFKPTLDHVVKHGILPPLVKDSTCSTAASATSGAKALEMLREVKEVLVEQKWCRGDELEVSGQGFRDAMLAIKPSSGFKTTLDHAVKNETLSPPTLDNICSATAAATSGATSTTKPLIKNTINTSKAKAVGATIIDFIWKVSTTFGKLRVGLTGGELAPLVLTVVFEHL